MTCQGRFGFVAFHVWVFEIMSSAAALSGSSSHWACLLKTAPAPLNLNPKLLAAIAPQVRTAGRLKCSAPSSLL